MLVQGRLDEAQAWARAQGLSIDDDITYIHEFEHITLAKLLIAQYRHLQIDNYIHDAMRLLGRLLKAAEEGGRMGSTIEILVLQALAYEAQGNIPSALVSLKRTLTLAEPECYVRTFVAEGTPIHALLKKIKGDDRTVNDYVHKLLASFEGIGFQTPPETQPLIEPLSERELEILQLIADGLTNREIGLQLYLSLNTVKAHTRNIYGKLGVNSRTQAAAKARTLGILPTT
jgi:LuxR family maltose regulon positive regulatory protein